MYIDIYIWVCLYVFVYVSEPIFVLLISYSCISLCHADICFATRAVILLLYVQFADRSHQTVLPNCTIRKEREPWQSDKTPISHSLILPSYDMYLFWNPDMYCTCTYVHIRCGSPSMYLCIYHTLVLPKLCYYY